MSRENGQALSTETMRQSGQEQVTELRESIALALSDYRVYVEDQTSSDAELLEKARTREGAAHLAELITFHTETLRNLMASYSALLNASDDEIAEAMAD